MPLCKASMCTNDVPEYGDLCPCCQGRATRRGALDKAAPLAAGGGGGGFLIAVALVCGFGTFWPTAPLGLVGTVTTLLLAPCGVALLLAGLLALYWAEGWRGL